MTPEERELRRALNSRSGEPSPEYRARLSAALGAERPVARNTPALAVLAAVFLAVAMIVVLVLARQGAHLTPRPGPASVPRTHATPTPTSEPGLAIGTISMFGESGWAVTYDSSGVIVNVLHTTDGGTSWFVATPGVVKGAFIFGFALIDGSRAWLFAGNNTSRSRGSVDLWSTHDAGQSWAKASAPGFVFRGALITFTDGTHGWFAAPGQPISQFQQQGIVIDRTVDGGKTWKLVAQTNFPPDHSTAGAPSVNCGKSDLSFLNANVGWLTGGCTGGLTFDVTTDGGVTWKKQSLAAPRGVKPSTLCVGGPCGLSAPRFSSPGFGYMVLHDTSLYPARSWFYESRDQGKSWRIHTLPGSDTRVVMLNSSVGYASAGEILDSSGNVIAAAPWLYRTDDGGTSWIPIQTNRQLPYAALTCISASKCWALSPASEGTDPTTQLYLTTDGGRTWNPMITA